jgi:hypothetical protein
MKSTRKPFVAPQLREEASLAGVTLISGGVPTRHCRKGTSARNFKRGGLTRHGHGT